jgi:acyl-coenzyme A synthetase/AMP-(fatty) acid ligase/uncharacterized membrane protein
MKKFLKVLFYIIAALYPVLVFAFLVVFKLPVRILSLCIIALAAAFFLSATGSRKKEQKKERSVFDWRPLISSVLFLAAGLFCFFTNQTIFLKLYSVVISVTLLGVFGSTFFFPPTVIFRFATLQDKTIKGSLAEKSVESYCRKVTIVWCIFFICNGSAAAYTAFFCSDRVWSVYNGGISYVLMGLLFTIEYIVRRQVDKKMPKVFTISKFKADSRKDDYILCYEDTWSSGKYKTWYDFLVDTAKMRRIIAGKNTTEWILHCEDYWDFLVSFIALLQCNKTILLTQNITESFIAEIKTAGIEFLTDQNVPDSLPVKRLIADAPVPPESEIRTAPSFKADETSIMMYTSGSTGKPKAIHQRMTEFELDNAFIISKWGGEFAKRKLVTTVSQHHIYGFLFGVSLPFACGVPFRRTRIEYPEEFEKLSDESYMIIAVPAFLKRTVEIENCLNMKDPFIFTSGGVLLPEVAEKTDKIFGFWPLEVYGSTETSGIAYRQSKEGPAWTPFVNAKIWKDEDGCLVIISPYIKDPAGFKTADLVDINSDGTFILKGRSDSIVKIEEKRISMTEVENRLLQSGLVKDVKVIAMEDTRQYLAAVIVFNDEGGRKFADAAKFEINQYFHNYLTQFFENVVIPKRWRYPDEIPVDIQGKKRREDIQALFVKPDAGE